MILLKSFPYLFLLCIPKSIVFAQTFTAYQTSVPYVSSATACPSNQYFDVALLQCSLCPASSTQKSTGKLLPMIDIFDFISYLSLSFRSDTV
jgi:hypothetical protein